MSYSEVLTKHFLNDIKDIKKDKALLERPDKKRDEILQNLVVMAAYKIREYGQADKLVEAIYVDAMIQFL